MTTTTTSYRAPKHRGTCIWGYIDDIVNIADGIDLVNTPGHGGYIVSPARLAQMPKHLRDCSFTKDNHFEHDCSWVAIPLAFPQYFSADAVEHAQGVYDRIYARR